MKYNILYVLIGIVAISGVLYFAFQKSSPEETVSLTGHKNATYILDGTPVTLVDGVGEVLFSDSENTQVSTVRHFGGELYLDLNEDGREDVVFLLTQDGGGSGTFFYAVAALNTEDGYIGSDGYFLGDRIAPQTIEVSQNLQHKNVVVVNYAERAPSEAMTTQPSVGKSVYLKLDPESIRWAIVEPNFEGEADPARMTLSMKEWQWQYTLLESEFEVHPKNPGAFSLTLKEDGTFSTKTDCNQVGGEYEVDGEGIAFKNIYSTKMYCEESQEQVFVSILEEATTYQFTSRGELIFSLEPSKGSGVFR